MNDLISKKIQELKYDADIVLARKPEGTSNIEGKSDFFDKDCYYVVTREKHTIEGETSDILVVNSLNDTAFPGALLLANSDLADNNPSQIYAKRAPITIRVDLPGLQEEGTALIENPSYSTVSAEINRITAKWFSLKEKNNYKTPGIFTFDTQEVFSASHLKSKTGFDLAKKLHLEFDADVLNKERYFIIQCKQVFFNASIDLPEQPGGYFAEDETWENLCSNGVSDAVPPVCVQNVAYGRIIYIFASTKDKSSTFKSNLDSALKIHGLDVAVNNDTQYSNEFQETKFSVFVLGGNAKEQMELIKNAKLSEVNKILIENSEFCPENPAAPICYTTRFLKNNESAMVHTRTQYITSKVEVHKNACFTVKNNAAYVSKCTVRWKEMSCKDGELVYSDWKVWESGDLTAGLSAKVNIPANATNLWIKSEGCTGLAWRWWNTNYEKQDVTIQPNLELTTKGTTLKQKVEKNF